MQFSKRKLPIRNIQREEKRTEKHRKVIQQNKNLKRRPYERALKKKKSRPLFRPHTKPLGNTSEKVPEYFVDFYEDKDYEYLDDDELKEFNDNYRKISENYLQAVRNNEDFDFKELDYGDYEFTEEGLLDFGDGDSSEIQQVRRRKRNRKLRSKRPHKSSQFNNNKLGNAYLQINS